MELEQIALLILSVVLMAIFLFVGDKVFGTRKVRLDSGYFLKAVLTAILIILLIIAAGAVAGFIGSIIPGVTGIVTVLGFVLASYVVRGILLKHATFERSAWVTLVAYLLVYIANGISQLLIEQPLVQYIG